MTAAGTALDLAALEAVIFDCDGVLTPGDLYYDHEGRRSLRFNSKDGFALALLCRTGLPCGVLSGRPIDIAQARLAELGIRSFVGRCRDKAQGFVQMCADLSCAPAHTAFVGDDIPDLGAFRNAGLRIAVADAASEVRAAAHWVTTAAGGHGAAREVCEAILKAKGVWQAYLQKYQ